MNAEKFWSVIADYNQHTILFQIVISFMVLVCSVYSFKTNNSKYIKLSLGATNLFIAVIFFGLYGTETIQKVFAFPLYIAIGIMMIFEGIKNSEKEMKKIGLIQIRLMITVVMYPVFSVILGNRYPNMVTNIMPCPVLSLSIVLYSCCQKQNKLLLGLFLIWGLTGIKSFIFNVYEDIILLICGFYCAYLVINLQRKDY